MEALRQHEHPFETVKRLSKSAVHGIGRAISIHGWSELPRPAPALEVVTSSEPNLDYVTRFPHGLRLCDPAEHGFYRDPEYTAPPDEAA